MTSAMRWVQLACMLVAAYGLGRRFSVREVCLLVVLVYGFYSAIGLCRRNSPTASLEPWSPDYRFSGGEHPNSQMQNFAMVCLAAVAMLGTAEWPRRGSVWLLFLSVPLLVLTGSRTACLSVLVALLVYWSLRVQPQTRLWLGMALGWAVSTAFLLLLLVAPSANDSLANALLLGGREDVAL